MKNKTGIKKISAKITFLILAGLTFIYGALTLGWGDWTGFIPSILGAGLSTVLIFELGIKRWTPISNLKAIKPMQKVGLVLAIFTFIWSILRIPAIGVDITWMNQFVGTLLIIEAGWTAFEINN